MLGKNPSASEFSSDDSNASLLRTLMQSQFGMQSEHAPVTDQSGPPLSFAGRSGVAESSTSCTESRRESPSKVHMNQPGGSSSSAFRNINPIQHRYRLAEASEELQNLSLQDRSSSSNPSSSDSSRTTQSATSTTVKNLLHK